MDSTFTVAKICDTSIFDVMEKDAETVISVINYIIEKGNTAETHENDAGRAGNAALNNGDYYDRRGVLHKRVSMKSAAGGWY